MRDPGRAPVIDGEVDASDLRQSHGARLPMGGVVGIGPVVAVAYVMQRYFVALNVGPRLLGYVRLPVAIVGWRKRQPPCKYATEKQRDNTYFARKSPNDYCHRRGKNRQKSSHNLVCNAEWSVKPHGAKCPGDSNYGRGKDEQLTDPANGSHQIFHYGSECSALLAG